MLNLGNFTTVESDDKGVYSKEHISTETNTKYLWDRKDAEYGWTVSEHYDGTWTKGRSGGVSGGGRRLPD